MRLPDQTNRTTSRPATSRSSPSASARLAAFLFDQHGPGA